MYKVKELKQFRFEPGGFPWHTFEVDPYRIALCCMEHETLSSFVDHYGPEIQDLYTRAEVDIRKVCIKRMRHGAFKCQASDSSHRYYYVDSTTGLVYLNYPYPWRRDDVYSQDFNPYTVFPGCNHARTKMYFAAPRTGTPLVQWCWKCENFFALADSFVLLGIDYRHPILSTERIAGTYPHRCSYVMCPYCFACDPKCDEQRLRSEERVRLNVLNPKGEWMESFTTVSLVAVRERVEQVLTAKRQSNTTYAACVEQLSVDQWRKDVLLGKYSKEVPFALEPVNSWG